MNNRRRALLIEVTRAIKSGETEDEGLFVLLLGAVEEARTTMRPREAYFREVERLEVNRGSLLTDTSWHKKEMRRGIERLRSIRLHMNMRMLP